MGMKLDSDRHLAEALDHRPVLVVLAGSNGAGKSTFFSTHLLHMGLRFINADILARELQLESLQAARVADALRAELVQLGESFITETVFSDPVGAKLGVFTAAMAAGYTVVLLYIGISGPECSEERVAQRVLQGGHDVPADRLVTRYPRTLANLRAAIPKLSQVFVYDNDDLRRPYHLIARYAEGQMVWSDYDPPDWWRDARPAT
jgi:predicted ABC-type ATPase